MPARRVVELTAFSNQRHQQSSCGRDDVDLNSNVSGRVDTDRVILADILEIATAELTDTGSFTDDYKADSLRAVEILAILEKEFSIRIPESELPKMTNFRNVLEVLGRNGW